MDTGGNKKPKKTSSNRGEKDRKTGLHDWGSPKELRGIEGKERDSRDPSKESGNVNRWGRERRSSIGAKKEEISGLPENQENSSKAGKKGALCRRGKKGVEVNKKTKQPPKKPKPRGLKGGKGEEFREKREKGPSTLGGMEKKRIFRAERQKDGSWGPEMSRRGEGG